MGAANGGKLSTSDLEKPGDHLNPLFDDKQTHQLPEEPRSQSSKMRPIRHIFYTVILLTLFLAVAFSASPHCGAPHVAVSSLSEEQQKFRELLNTLEPSSLHDVLHKHLRDKYRHGIFKEDKAALEAVHLADTSVARSLVDLARRQATPSSNSTVRTATTVATTDITTTATVPATSTELTTISPPPATTDTSSSSTIVDPPPSSSAPPTPSTQSSIKPPDPTSSPSSASPPRSTSPPPSSQSSVTTEVVYQTTLEGGQQTTVTAVTVVPADQVTQTSANTARTSTGKASLQTNAGKSNKMAGLNVLVGAVGIAVAGVI